MRIANCIESFSFHEQNQIFGVFLLNKRQYSMEQERAPKGTKDLFTKRIRSVARGAYSGSKRTGHANKWKQELKDGYNGKGDLCFQNR
jgi:hypothetical protein